MSALAEALVAAQRDARSEARYTADPCAEPDTGEVKDTLARTGLGDADCPPERRYGRG